MGAEKGWEDLGEVTGIMGVKLNSLPDDQRAILEELILAQKLFPGWDFFPGSESSETLETSALLDNPFISEEVLKHLGFPLPQIDSIDPDYLKENFETFFSVGDSEDPEPDFTDQYAGLFELRLSIESRNLLRRLVSNQNLQKLSSQYPSSDSIEEVLESLYEPTTIIRFLGEKLYADLNSNQFFDVSVTGSGKIRIDEKLYYPGWPIPYDKAELHTEIRKKAFSNYKRRSKLPESSYLIKAGAGAYLLARDILYFKLLPRYGSGSNGLTLEQAATPFKISQDCTRSMFKKMSVIPMRNQTYNAKEYRIKLFNPVFEVMMQQFESKRCQKS